MTSIETQSSLILIWQMLSRLAFRVESRFNPRVSSRVFPPILNNSVQQAMPHSRSVMMSWLFCFSLTFLAFFDSQCTAVADDDATKSTPQQGAKLAPPSRKGEDWPQFLGLTQDGISRETGLLDVWPEAGPATLWEKEVGTGYSAPSVRGARLVLHHRIGNEEIIDCFNAATGEGLWRHAYESRFRDPYGYNNGPRCSPILTEQHCITLGAEGKLTCLNLMDGSLIWKRDLKLEYEIPDGFFGVGPTPILEGDKLIVLVGGQPDSGVVAFDSTTGKKLWNAVGKSTWDKAETGWSNDPVYEWSGEEMVVSYSSPIAVTIHEKRHVLCLMRQGLVSLDPETGQVNFKHWFRSRTHESVNAACPVVVGDTILLSAAYRVGSELLKVNPDGKSYEVLWSNPRNLLTHWSTSIPLDGCFLGFSGRHENEGELRCIDAKTGDVKWSAIGYDDLSKLTRNENNEIVERESGKVVPWPLYGRGSKILADGKFIVLSERGTLALLKATTEKWEEISRFSAPRMHYPCWTAPVLSRGRLYLRCEDALICLDLQKPE